MKQRARKLSYIMGIFIILLAVSCSDSGTANVQIRISPPPNVSLQKKAPASLIDRFLMLFSSPAYAQTVSGVSSVVLRISGPGMSLFERTYPGDTVMIAVAVEAGKSRTFELTVNLDPSGASAVLSYRGAATVDLKAGETKELPITMAAWDMKIVVPDYCYHRLVMVPSLNSPTSEWRICTWENLGYAIDYNFNPYDVAFDSDGKIYVVNCQYSNNTVIRLDAFPESESSSVEPYTVATITNSYLYTIDIDKVNNILYCCTSGADLYRKDLADPLSDLVQLDTLNGDTSGFFSENGIVGISADSSGYLYLTQGYSPYLLGKYDIASQQIAVADDESFIITEIIGGSLNDVIARNGLVYVGVSYDYFGSDYNNRIISYNSDLVYQDEINTLPGSSSDYFYGPRLFLSGRREEFYVVDEAEYSANDRILSLDDLNDTGWDSAGSGFFRFFNCY